MYILLSNDLHCNLGSMMATSGRASCILGKWSGSLTPMAPRCLRMQWLYPSMTEKLLTRNSIKIKEIHNKLCWQEVFLCATRFNCFKSSHTTTEDGKRFETKGLYSVDKL